MGVFGIISKSSKCTSFVFGVRLIVSKVTANADGLGHGYQRLPSERMEDILTQLLAFNPDVVLIQEVIPEMYEVVKRRLAGWSVYRRRDVATNYFNVSAVRFASESWNDKTTSNAFDLSDHGRHYVTVRRRGWTIVNVHAESGSRVQERDHRAAQFLHMILGQTLELTNCFWFCVCLSLLLRGCAEARLSYNAADVLCLVVQLLVLLVLLLLLLLQARFKKGSQASQRSHPAKPSSQTD